MGSLILPSSGPVYADALWERNRDAASFSGWVAGSPDELCDPS